MPFAHATVVAGAVGDARRRAPGLPPSKIAVRVCVRLDPRLWECERAIYARIGAHNPFAIPLPRALNRLLYYQEVLRQVLALHELHCGGSKRFGEKSNAKTRTRNALMKASLFLLAADKRLGKGVEGGVHGYYVEWRASGTIRENVCTLNKMPP